MKEVDQVHVVALFFEVQLQQVVNGAFEHERVVNRDHAHLLNPVPARLTATGDRPVHYVV